LGVFVQLAATSGCRRLIRSIGAFVSHPTKVAVSQ
jgi:hypothetical protein